MNDLANPIFHDETKAREWLESHLWPEGPVCPHCGTMDVTALQGKAHRPGLYQCKDKHCRQQFTVTVGTLYERSKIPLTKWLMATYLLSASKKGMSSRQLGRMLGVSVKSAWFMTHRIREAMQDTDNTPLGGEGKTVEVDETFLGPTTYDFDNDKGWVGRRGSGSKMKVFALVERDGRSRAIHIPDLRIGTIREYLFTNLRRESDLVTDEAHHYRRAGKEFASHGHVVHSKGQYGKGPIHTNTIEGYFSIFKRGMRGIYQHCNERHLQRYLYEFDFRYNSRDLTDMERATEAAKGIAGKRLTYRRTGEGEARN